MGIFNRLKILLNVAILVIFKSYKINIWPYCLLHYYHIKSRLKLRLLLNNFKTSTVFCIGNGPSINSENLELLNGHVVIFTNLSFELRDKIKASQSLILYTDYIRFKEGYDKIPKDITTICSINKFDINYNEAKLYRNCIFIMPTHDLVIDKRLKKIEFIANNKPGISNNSLNRLWINYSVIFSAMQVSYALNASKIILLGVDMNYKSGMTHFSSSIKPLWNDFDYYKHAKPSFIFYKRIFEAQNISLVNATCSTQEDVLDKMKLEELI